MDRYYNYTRADILNRFDVDADTGLTSDEVAKRREIHGANRLASKRQKSLLTIFIEQFKSSMVVILFLAAIISGTIGVIEGEGMVETVVILAILVINAIIGTFEERRAQISLAALSRMSSPHSKVLRNGQIEEIDSTDIVPGDIVILDTGDIIPADMRLIEAINLQIQESALTGESLPIEKSIETIADTEVPLGDRFNMAFSSGLVTYGRGRGVIVAAGMKSEVGKIADMLQSTEATETPMTRRLEQLGKVLGYAALSICAVIFVVGMLYGNNWLEMLMMAVSLAVAAIPEGLQIVSTIVLAIGVQRLVKQNAIVRRLPSVETLGSTTVICSDKTGTLTQNRMSVVEGWLAGRRINLRELLNTESEQLSDEMSLLLTSSLLCTDSHLKMLPDGGYELSGDPTESAIVELALRHGINRNELEAESPRLAEVPFDSKRKRMATINRRDNGHRVNVKGGVDELLAISSRIYIDGKVRPISDSDRDSIRKENEAMAQSALRLLAVAYKDIESLPPKVDAANVESDLIFIGLLGMIDPARPEALEAVEKCRRAGIRPVMITGDHIDTALAIASEIGIYRDGDRALTGMQFADIDDDTLANDIERYSVYARVAPEHKVRIVRAWQRHNQIVAMTGDGVNDAPALKQADIGVSMGIVGTEVAKGASDIVLTDDNFATIVAAVEEGRRIYDNIVKVIQFLLSCNVGEILLIFIASIFNLGNPLTPILILWINLVTDSLPALALSMDPAESDIMTRRPRDPNSGFFTGGMIRRIIYQGITVGLISLAAYYIGLNKGVAAGVARPELLAQTMAFSVLGFSQLFHVRNLHSNRLSSFRTNPFNNKTLIGAIIISALLMLIILLIPGPMELFGVVKMSGTEWLIVMLLSMTPILVVEIAKALKLNHSDKEY